MAVENDFKEQCPTTEQRSDDIRFALSLTHIRLVWMTIEGAASLLLAWASKSLLLEAFGIHSVVPRRIDLRRFPFRLKKSRNDQAIAGVPDRVGSEVVVLH